MENRRTRQISALPDLPEETLVSIFSLLDAKSTVATSKTCSLFARLANDHSVWHRVFYTEYNELLSHQLHGRPAFIAEYFLRKITIERVDLAQHYTRLLNLHLDLHRGKPWTHYYIAYCHLYGYGKPVNEIKALDCFMDGASADDYRCLEELNLLLINIKYHEPAKFKPLFDKLTARNMMERLINLLSDDTSSLLYAPELLAHYYHFGIGVEQNDDIAEELFLDSIKRGSTMNVEDYFTFKHKTLGISLQHLPLPIDHRERLEALLLEISNFTEQISHTAVKAVLYYNIAFQYGLINNRKKKNQFLKLAIEHGSIDAKIEYSEYNYSLHTTDHTARQNAIENMTDLAKKGNREALFKLFCWQSQERDLDERLNELKVLHPNAAGYIAYLAAQAFGEYPAEDILEHPYRIIWMQLAALNNHEYSIDKLKDLEEEQDPFVLCALGIIHTYGTHGGHQELIDFDKATLYFYQAQQLQPGIMKEYARTGLSEGLICDEVAKFLESQNMHCQPKLR